jgi:hypothetical protein
MNYILVMIIINSAGSSVTSQSIKFYSQAACLKAMSRVVDMEKHFTVKAICVEESL